MLIHIRSLGVLPEGKIGQSIMFVETRGAAWKDNRSSYYLFGCQKRLLVGK